MASMNKTLCVNLINNFLPTFGNPQRVKTPVWDDSQRMFIGEQYESAAGHRYYNGVRFCDRIAIVERVGLYHNWTYLDCLEIYSFDGRNKVLVQKRDYDKVFRDEAFVRQESQTLVKNYLQGMLKVQGKAMNDKELEEYAKALVDSCFKSFLDKDYNMHLTQILPLLEKH